MLLVGEAVGLVNSLTGEEVDFALESGRLPAAHLMRTFADGDLSTASLAKYDHLLCRRFQPQFEFCARVRDVLVHPALVDLVVRLQNECQDLKTWLTNVILGNEPASASLATSDPSAVVGRPGGFHPTQLICRCSSSTRKLPRLTDDASRAGSPHSS